MNKLPLFAMLAVAATATATATAADLKDPAAVARDWHNTIAQAGQLAPSPKTLREQSTAPATTPLTGIFRSETPPPPISTRPTEPLYDAPSSQVPRVLPDNLPPGAKPWHYDGRTYWLIPLGADPGT